MTYFQNAAEGPNRTAEVFADFFRTVTQTETAAKTTQSW